MVRLGAKAGTQNIDRILRLPGTINLPNKAKLKAGRTACPTKLIGFNGARYSLDSFPLPNREDHREDDHQESKEDKDRTDSHSEECKDKLEPETETALDSKVAATPCGGQ
jgi:hypothetical protein